MNRFDDKELKEILRLVCNFSKRFFGTDVEADELTQTTMEKLFKAKVLPKRVSRQWIHATTANAKNDILRRAYREQQRLDRSVCVDSLRAEVSIGDRFSDPSVNSEHSDPFLLQALNEAIGNLSKARREAFLLYAEGYSYLEIASFTRSNLNTVRSRIHYARRDLKHALSA